MRDGKRMRRALALSLAAVLGLGLGLAPLAQAQEPGEHTVVIYFFWGDGCPHCAQALPFLQELAERYPVDLRAYEVWYDEASREAFFTLAAAYGFEPTGVPTIFIGDGYLVGFSEEYEDILEQAVAACAASGCPDRGQGVLPGVPTAAPRPTLPAAPAPTLPAAASATPVPGVPTPAAQASPAATPGAAAPANGAEASAIAAPAVFSLPLIGAVDLEAQSLLVSTSLIALVDGFNPCSLWVLTVLLALVVHTGSRAKTIVIGLVFITVTALVYVLFILGLFSALRVAGYLPWLQAAVAGVALVFALVNIKDYFWPKRGVSLSISDERKPGLFRRMRAVLQAGNSWWGLASATVVLAAGASLVEFSCTAGFPLLWTNLLAARGVEAGTFAWLLVLYMLIYQIDELAIFLAAVFTMRAMRLEEKHGRLLKLFGGALMLALAATMIARPALLNSVGGTLAVFGAALGGALLTLAVERAFGRRKGKGGRRRGVRMRNA